MTRLAQVESEASSAETPARPFLPPPRLEVPIPGVTFSQSVGANSETTPFLTEYVVGIYRYALGIIGVVAAVFIMIGGFQYLVAGGDASKISKAKERIGNALIGLMLALGSYALLFAINPNLVAFQGLQFINVQRESWVPPDVDEAAATDAEAEAESQAYTSSSGDGFSYVPSRSSKFGYNNVPYFAQFASPWQSRYPGDKAPPAWPGDWSRYYDGTTPPNANFTKNGGRCDTVRARGCGTTSLAMILSYYGESADPFVTAAFGLGCTGGMPSAVLNTVHTRWNIKKTKSLYWSGDSKPSVVALKAAGANPTTEQMVVAANINPSALAQANQAKINTLTAALVAKKPAIFNCQPCYGWNSSGKIGNVYGGHYVVLTGYDPAAKVFYVNDPGANETKRINYMSFEQFLISLGPVFLFDKK